MALNRGWTYHDRVMPRDAGVAISAFYATRYAHSPVEVWRRRLQAGQLSRNGLVCHQDCRLERGDQLAWRRPPWQEPEVPLRFEVIHDDGDLLVVNKPSGLPVMPAGGFLEHTLLHRLALSEPDQPPRPVHRLGRGSSGLVVCARQASTRSWLSAALRDSTATLARTADPSGARCTKTYRALVRAGVLPQQGVMGTAIGMVPDPCCGHLWAALATGLPSESRYELLERSPLGDLVTVTILSGRPHQIRIHMARAGAPLVGDPLYAPGGGRRCGSTALPGDMGYQLHAHRLVLSAPAGTVPLSLEAPLPAGLRTHEERQEAGAATHGSAALELDQA